MNGFVKATTVICVLYANMSFNMGALFTTRKSTNSTNVMNNIQDASWETWCKFQLNSFSCEGHGLHGQYYYDIKLGSCRSGEAGSKCPFNKNAFESVHECYDTCIDFGENTLPNPVGPKIFCRMQPDFGNCNDYHPRWYYDVSEKRCKGFSFSGCGGNSNRFLSYQICMGVCAHEVQYEGSVDR